jgi:hypothetical protein
MGNSKGLAFGHQFESFALSCARKKKSQFPD